MSESNRYKQEEQSVAASLRPASKFYRFLWEIRDELLADGFEDALLGSYRPRGQDPCPPGMLALVLLLQRYEGLSDADAVEAAENDRRWQLVLGTLGVNVAPFGQGSLVRFRTRMMANDLDKKLLERTVELAKKTGKFGWQRLRVALDSSPLEGAGRVEDTWNLIGRAMSKVVAILSTLVGVDEATIIGEAGLTTLSASSVKAALDIDWDDEDQRREGLERLLTEVSALEKWVKQRAKAQAKGEPLKSALGLLRQIAAQDTEPDPNGGGPRIKEGVTPDRIISASDTEMRHGRKSRSKRFDGYKRHIAIAHNLILATAVRPANRREHEPAEELLQTASAFGQIQVLDIDRGYLPSPAVERLHAAGAQIRSRAWQTANAGFFTKEHFEIDLQRRSVTCPAGRTVKIGVAGKVAFRADECAACELKSLCTPARRRSLSVHRQEALLIRLRQDLKTKSGRRELRKRVAVEHRLARIGFIQGRRARYKGSRKNELDLNRSAAIANLQEVERLRRCA